MILLLLVALPFLPSNAKFFNSFRVQNSDSTRVKCDAMPYRTAIIENGCFFAVTKKVENSEDSAECSSIFPGAQLASNVPNDVFSILMLDKSKFHVGKGSGAKQSICTYENTYKSDAGEQSNTNIGKEVAPTYKQIIFPEGLKLFIRLQYSESIPFLMLEEEERWGKTRILNTTILGLILPPGTVMPECACLTSLTRRQHYLNIFRLVTNSASIGQSKVAGINSLLGLVGKTPGCCGATVPIYEHYRHYSDKYWNLDYNTSSTAGLTTCGATKCAWTTTSSKPLFYIWPQGKCGATDQAKQNPGTCVASLDKKSFSFQGLTPFTRLQYSASIPFLKLESEERWGSPQGYAQILDKSTLGRILPPGTVMPECACLSSLTRRQHYPSIFQLTTGSASVLQSKVAGMNVLLGLVGNAPDCCGATVPIYEHKRHYTAHYYIHDYNTTSSTSSPWTTTATPLFYIWPSA